MVNEIGSRHETVAANFQTIETKMVAMEENLTLQIKGLETGISEIKKALRG